MMTRWIVVGALLAAVPMLGGCTAALVAGGATAGAVAADRRSAGTVVDDFKIRSDINTLWFEHDTTILSRLELQVNEGRVLLTGNVPKPEQRIEAVRLAWQADGVKEVINQIKVKDEKSLSGYARDSWISTQLRTRLLFEEGVESISYSIETMDGVIYLMGIAKDQAELKRVTDLARNIGYVRRVVSYVRVADDANQGHT